LQINEQNDHKNGFLLSPVKQQNTQAFFLLHLGSTLPELTNNFTSFTKLTESVKNINTDSKYTSELSDTLMSSLLSRLNAKNIPNIENVIYTGSKNAVLTGNDFSNVLIGSTGNDILSGGKGDDKLIGGDGNDYFVFSENDGNDQILDFNVGDRILFKGSINLSELILNEDASGQILSLNGTTINLIGISDLTISTDWIGFIK
jgi:Ca2+-binding RTX toxin-like protein